MIAEPVFIDICKHLLSTREFFGQRERFEDRTRVAFAASKIVNGAYAGRVEECADEARNIKRMDVVAYLLPLVAEYAVFAIFEIALDEITQETVELYSAVMWAG